MSTSLNMMVTQTPTLKGFILCFNRELQVHTCLSEDVLSKFGIGAGKGKVVGLAWTKENWGTLNGSNIDLAITGCRFEAKRGISKDSEANEEMKDTQSRRSLQMYKRLGRHKANHHNSCGNDDCHLVSLNNSTRS
jgi:hypothetical protein